MLRLGTRALLSSRSTRIPAAWAAALAGIPLFLAMSLVGGSACSKNKTEVPGSASAAPASGSETAVAVGGGEAAGNKAAGAEDTTPPPGVDLSKLDDFERKVFFRVLNKEASACGKAQSLIASVRTDKGCRKSLYAARYVARLVDGGFTDSEISESIQKRFRGDRKQLNLSDAPVKGNPAAPVMVAEFVDYECPHCKRVQPVLRQILEEYKDEVKVAFKHYPLGGHTNARVAAEAAMAANKQGKFWAYNEKLWAISENITPAALEQIAKDVGLDVTKWRSDLESDAVKAAVERDHAEGVALALDHTPTIYINGREFTDSRDADSMRDWINEELNR
jgi:protein-disulfide isomerase